MHKSKHTPQTGVPDLPLPVTSPKHRTDDGAMVWLLTAESKLAHKVSGILGSNGYPLQIMEDPAELWENGRPRAPACLLCSHPLRVGVTGYHILEEIVKRAWPLPTLLVNGHWNITEVVRAMKSGAENCLLRPLESSILLQAIDQGLHQARLQWEQARVIADARKRAATLDAREVEVVKRVTSGYLNKEIADQLNLALITIKVYRARAMKKLKAGNAAELTRIASLAGLCDD
jgi:FixJ family two-component response regulator